MHNSCLVCKLVVHGTSTESDDTVDDDGHKLDNGNSSDNKHSSGEPPGRRREFVKKVGGCVERV